MDKIIEEAKLVAVRHGEYTVYVFQKTNNEYIMCTRLPNWQVPEVSINDVGFLEYQFVTAGETYYDPSEEKHITYKYSNVYFINFVNKSDLIKNNDIIL